LEEVSESSKKDGFKELLYEKIARKLDQVMSQ